MSKAEDRYLEHFQDGRVRNCSSKEAFLLGYCQAEKDLLENKHEKSWRLDEKLWKGIKDIEEASYQYMYDASNDWAYEIPTWEDVQDAFKAGNEWKEGFELTWEDMLRIDEIISEVYKNSYSCITRNIYEEVLKRFKAQKVDIVMDE